MAPNTLTRLQLGLLGLVLACSVLWIGHRVFRDPDVAFLPPGAEEGWIGFRFPVFTGVVRTLQPPEPFVFARRFTLASPPERAVIEVQAIHTVELALNGEPLLDGERRAWREPVVVDLAGRLRAGPNLLVAHVRNPLGPGLLRVRVREGGLPVASDPRWTVAPPGSPAGAARLVDDTRLHPASLRVATPLETLEARAVPLLGVLLLASLLFYTAAPRLPRALAGRGALATPVAVTAGWVALLVTRLADLPLEVGFDAHGHLDYVHFLRERHALPPPALGVSTFHPPLFHAIEAAITGLLGAAPGRPGSGLVYRLLPMGAGIGSVWLVWWVARRLFAGDALRTGLAALVAGLLPMHVYISAYVSNESTTAFLATAVLALAVHALLAERPRPAAWVALALVGGLALLTKYSGFVVVPLALGFAALRPWLLDGRPFPRTVGLGAALAVGALAVGGWFYARSWWLTGTPFPWNLEAGGSGLWWHLPGFHTVDFYTSFGESLRHPLFAGFASHWDGLYSTFWGDGLGAGGSSPVANPGGWSLDWMLATYPLALPVTGLLALGALRAFRLAVRDPDRARRLAWTLLLLVAWTVGLAHLDFSIQFASYANSKAFYALPALLPLSLVGGLGLAWPVERLRGPRGRPWQALYLGLLTTFTLVLVLAFRG